MPDSQYSNRELDRMFKDIKEQLDRIEAQTVKHNGRLTRVEKTLLILGCTTGTLLITNGSEFVSFVMKLIA